MELIVNPTEKHLNQIKFWLLEEQNNYAEGFYCNWNVILASFEQNNFYCLVNNNITIGFLCWRKTSKVSIIEIAEIKREKRGYGFGRIMINKALIEFKYNGSLVVNLECSPPSSEPIWESFGFIPYSKLNRELYQKMYKTLVKSLEPLAQQKDVIGGLVIELWKGEPYQTTKSESTWKWNISFENNSYKLRIPIISPCHSDWRIRYRDREKVIFDNKVKYFPQKEILFDDFLIIDELPIIE